MFCEKMVFAYDGSDVAKKALEKTVAIAKTNASIQIDVLFASELPQTPYVIEDVFEDMQQSMHEHGDAILTETKEKLSSLPNHIDYYAVEGRAPQTILQHAADQACDLIVIGNRGLTGIKEFLGSVSHYVVHHSQVPVLVVR
ncbi:universal stress protein [Lentibacillus cibarius]|uniref:Universal stress protein n=1 Tax=Lentibacillus cibarius TaxID=2583219 RepID=A0A5S3QR68_9BACI|nr:universal stress protein [Lentibacillus cibarius]TMN23116.1 universal stress protein [Lentibacillus cibarius]